MTGERVVVVGQLARDLVVVLDALPAAGASGAVTQRVEVLGGKGANQAVGLAQLGARPSLVAVAGDDEAGRDVLAQAARDGVDMSLVAVRAGVATALIVEVLERREGEGAWRYLEHLPADGRLREADVAAAADVLQAAAATLVQLQTPAAAALAAARTSHAAGRLVVLDGAPEDPEAARELLRLAGVVRADAREAGLWGVAREDAAPGEVARALLAAGPRVVALGTGEGNLVAWDGGEEEVAHRPGAVDTTGGGDAFTAALTLALVRGEGAGSAARAAASAAARTVGHVGGRPRLG